MPACPNCGQGNLAIALFCLACGTRLREAAPTRGEERKVVTVLFCDLVGFTTRSDRSDPEDVRATLSSYFTRLRRAIERHGGTVEKFIGDAVVAVFGAPIAHEDDPERAVRCALAMLSAIDDLNDGTPGLDLAVRIGITTGETLVAIEAEAVGEGIVAGDVRSEEHTSELQSRPHLVCRLLLEKKKNNLNLLHKIKNQKNQN